MNTHKIKFISIIILLGVLNFTCRKTGTASRRLMSASPSAPGTPPQPTKGNGVHSTWYLTGNGWDTTAAGNYGAVAFYVVNAPDVTQAVIDSAQVHAYMKGDSTTAIGQDVLTLPYVLQSGPGSSDVWDFALSTPGQIRFIYKSTMPWSLAELGTVSFRYVIVPGAFGIH